jgi:hypothetical protein
MSFEESIQKWVSLDNQLRSIQDKTKQLREDKNYKILWLKYQMENLNLRW